ncbi:MAG: hypothetical protein QM401_01290 [Bacillota bacterium]|nr:hypothetical protein [Bacillota bacterium]
MGTKMVVIGLLLKNFYVYDRDSIVRAMFWLKMVITFTFSAGVRKTLLDHVRSFCGRCRSPADKDWLAINDSDSWELK